MTDKIFKASGVDIGCDKPTKVMPLLVVDPEGKPILEVHINGDIVLRDKVIGNDVEVAWVLAQYGDNMEKFTGNLGEAVKKLKEKLKHAKTL